MFSNRVHSPIRFLVATVAVGVIGFGVASAPAVDAAGLRNCVDVTGPAAGRAGCWELVWADGVQYRMTFSNTSFKGATPGDLDPFYVVAPQTAAPQGEPPAFPHDHVVSGPPAHNHGSYSVQMQGFFVLCSGQGIVSGSCVPNWTTVSGAGTLPFAASVDGHALTSVEPIEAAGNAGLVALVNLGPGAVIIATISGN